MEAVCLQSDQHIYTTAEVERLLWQHIGRRSHVSTHGRIVRSYAMGRRYICPVCDGEPFRPQRGERGFWRPLKRRTNTGKVYFVWRCENCEGKGRVVDIMPAGSREEWVSDSLLSRADLFAGLKGLSDRYRALILCFYGTDDGMERIGQRMRRFNGGNPVPVRTLYRWRKAAVEALTRRLNRGGA